MIDRKYIRKCQIGEIEGHNDKRRGGRSRFQVSNNEIFVKLVSIYRRKGNREKQYRRKVEVKEAHLT